VCSPCPLAPSHVGGACAGVTCAGMRSHR
jgi:hypothetical protein